ncbi:restriction endonuclease subunit S [Candidatus Haliotispira prima]|uniref:Restriction endonuclease subunit S n=1 Tax=Candidatus Haliotispira prima TaxID=3034016 RepID=A0ABY8MMH3_9SPIO|nr:restriction endonuclease subunit S [Candidatus Haliotispira prima]
MKEMLYGQLLRRVGTLMSNKGHNKFTRMSVENRNASTLAFFGDCPATWGHSPVFTVFEGGFRKPTRLCRVQPQQRENPRGMGGLMGSEWIVSTLGELVEIEMGQSPKGTECHSTEIGTPLLNGPTEFGSYHPYPTQFTTDPKRFSKSGDILFCVRGSTTGRMNWSDKDYAIGRGLAAFRHKEGKEYNSFLKGLIDTKLPELLSSATGSTFPNVSKNQLHELVITVPPLPEQQAIAHILGSLDDKIELNRQMNATLEGMAQALFQSWFVDFDPVIDNALAAGKEIPEEFKARAELRKALGEGRKPLPEDVRKLFPDSFQETKEMGWIPRGWGVAQIGELLELAYGKALASKFREPGPCPVYGSGGIGGYHKEALVKGPGIIVGRKGTVGSIFWENDDFFPIDTVFFVKQLQEIPLYWLYQRFSLMDIASLGSDSAVPGINRNALHQQKWVIPNSEVFQKYWHLSEKRTEKLYELKEQNALLTKLRDTLLPKLISGKLRVGEIPL